MAEGGKNKKFVKKERPGAQGGDVWRELESAQLFACIDIYRGKAYVNESRLGRLLENAKRSPPLYEVINQGVQGPSAAGGLDVAELIAGFTKALQESRKGGGDEDTEVASGL